MEFGVSLQVGKSINKMREYFPSDEFYLSIAEKFNKEARKKLPGLIKYCEWLKEQEEHGKDTGHSTILE